MEHEFAYEITDQLMHGAARRLLRRQLGWRVVAIVVLAVLLFILVCSDGDQPFICGLFAGAFLMLALLVAVAVLSRRRRTERFLSKLGDRKARCLISDEGIVVENAAARSFVKWNVVERLVRQPGAWLLFIGRQQYFVLPAAPLDGEAGAFVERRVAAAGGRLR